MNITSDIEKETQAMTDWRGDMYRNIKTISEYLVSANKIMSSSADTKDKQINDLNKIILDFESIGDKISDLADQKKKKDIQAGLNEVKEQYNKAVKMLNNYKSLIK
jgi:Mg2+ and Co2+ transporter CorA